MTTYFARTFPVCDGVTTNFAIPFPYLSTAHVKVYLNSVLQVTGYSFASPTVIQFVIAPGSSVGLEIRRVTPAATALHVIQSGTISPPDINDDFTQVLYIIQETTDQGTADAASLSSLLTAAQAAAGQAGADRWSRPVKGQAAAVPGSPAIGDRWLLTANPHINEVAEYTTTGWIYSGTPLAGQTLEVNSSPPSTMRYSQEAYDSGVAWRYVYLNGGGPRGYLEPSDEPSGVANLSVTGRFTCLATTGIGTGANPILHFQKARGSIGAPAIPLAGDFIGSTGYRHWDPTSGIFGGSSVAVEVTLTTNPAAGNFYCGSQYGVETTPSGGIRRQCTMVADHGGSLFYGTGGTAAGAGFTATGSHRWMYGPESTSGMGAESISANALLLNRNGTDGSLVLIRKANVDVGSISVTGAATAYNTSSDERLKDYSVTNRDFGAMIDSIEITDAAFHSDPHNRILSVSAQQVASTGFLDAVTYPEARLVPAKGANGEQLYTPYIPMVDAGGAPVTFAEHVETGEVDEGGKPLYHKVLTQRQTREELMRLETEEEAQERHWESEYGRYGLLALWGVQQDRKEIAELKAQLAALVKANKKNG